MPIPKESLYTDRVLGPGEIPEHNPINNARSFAAEEAGIKFGRAVMAGTEPENEVKIYAGASGVFKGVTVFNTDAGDLDNSQHTINDAVAVADQGVINVFVEEAVAVGDTVRIRHTASGSLVAGSFATTSDAGKTTVLSGAEYRETGASGTAIKMYLNGPFSTSDD